MRPLPSLGWLHSLFNYDPETGRVTWAEDNLYYGKGHKAGDPVGSLSDRGYLKITLREKGKRSPTYKLRLHRIAWALHYGEDPYPLTIDHINHDRTDNRISNLRAVTMAENSRNKRKIR